jgi:competence protein ComEA
MRPTNTNSGESWMAPKAVSAPPEATEHGAAVPPCSVGGKLRDSVWRPVLLKTLSIAAGMVGLAAIGSVSTLRGAPGNDTAANDTAGSAHWAALVGSSLSPAAPTRAGVEPLRGETAGPSNATPTEASSAPAPSRAVPGGPPAASGSAAPGVAQSGVTADGKVILNLANASELDRLPGVGKKTAERIIELRSRLGRFKKLSDLLRVKGIGTKSFQKMLPELVLDAPQEIPPAQ